MFEKARSFLLDEDRGVSPVIGVILMVAITVILAAVIATFVMNMGPDSASPPNAQLDWESVGSDEYDLVHSGGEAVPESEVAEDSGASSIPSGTLLNPSNDEWTASDVVVENVDSGDTITLVWENPSSDETQILFEGEAP